MIAVTEPRRVAAVSVSHRVAYEMGLSQRYECHRQLPTSINTSLAPPPLSLSLSLSPGRSLIRLGMRGMYQVSLM